MSVAMTTVVKLPPVALDVSEGWEKKFILNIFLGRGRIFLGKTTLCGQVCEFVEFVCIVMLRNDVSILSSIISMQQPCHVSWAIEPRERCLFSRN